MSKRIAVNHRVNLILKATSRAAIRAEIVGHWLAEEPGDSGNRHTYRYDVERLSDGAHVYLTRPARLNKGMDFVIYCEGFTRWKKGTDKPPRHKDIETEIAYLANSANPGSTSREQLGHALLSIWNCQPPDDVLREDATLASSIRFERLLKICRWFFIEQDLTYWTDSGRWMLRRGLEGLTGPWIEQLGP